MLLRISTTPLETEALYGFGGPFTGLASKQGSGEQANIGCECDGHTNEHDSSHLTMTYAALVSLLVLGDDLSRVARGPITQALKRLQLENGCFMSCVTDPQADLRFLYSAAVISHLLNDWSGFDRVKALEFIQQCETYEHGFARTPGLEAHGGTTYCAVATLGLLGGEALLDQKTLQRDVEGGEDEAGFQARVSRAGFKNKEATRRWCLERQLTGFQGRVNKPTDTCYSFWIGGALAVLGSMDLVNEELNRGFLMETQHKKIGGFAKWVDHFPGKCARVQLRVVEEEEEAVYVYMYVMDYVYA
jgi:geranylgeranyl transferase type-1 subunit beta